MECVNYFGRVQVPGQGNGAAAAAKRARSDAPDAGFNQFRFSGGAAGPTSSGSKLTGLSARPPAQVFFPTLPGSEDPSSTSCHSDYNKGSMDLSTWL